MVAAPTVGALVHHHLLDQAHGRVLLAAGGKRLLQIADGAVGGGLDQGPHRSELAFGQIAHELPADLSAGRSLQCA